MVSRANSSLRLLQIAPRLPWPLDTGAKLRNFHLARVLSRQATVALLAFDGEQRSGDELNAVYDSVSSVPREGHNSLAKMLRGAVGATPLPLLNYTASSMTRELQTLLATRDFDIVHFESVHLMPYLPAVRAAKKRALAVLDWHNIESELLAQYSDRESNPLKRSYARRTANLMRKVEVRATREFNAHVVVSETDAQRLRRMDPDARIYVVENGVEVTHFDQVVNQPGASRNRIVFVASMDYHANIDAAVWFAREVWPSVHALEPDLVFTIVGRDPAATVRELASLPGVEVTGTVDDVRPFYREAIAAVAPLRVGGGSRLKILEAMAARVPVIATTLGAEGLDVKPDENILIADSPETMRDAIVSLAQNAERQAQLIESGRGLVRDRYDWSQLGARLFESYQALLSESPTN